MSKIFTTSIVKGTGQSYPRFPYTEDQTMYYMEILKAVASRSTCDRKKVGAIIVRNKSIISTGYNGAPRGIKHCSEQGHIFDSPEDSINYALLNWDKLSEKDKKSWEETIKDMSTGGLISGLRRIKEKDIIEFEIPDKHCILTVHAEMNTILQASRNGINIEEADMFCTTKPCYNCMKNLINSGLKNCFYLENYEDQFQKHFEFNSYISFTKIPYKEVYERYRS